MDSFFHWEGSVCLMEEEEAVCASACVCVRVCMLTLTLTVSFSNQKKRGRKDDFLCRQSTCWCRRWRCPEMCPWCFSFAENICAFFTNLNINLPKFPVKQLLFLFSIWIMYTDESILYRAQCICCVALLRLLLDWGLNWSNYLLNLTFQSKLPLKSLHSPS